jgi:hypothetical protein
LEVKEIDRGKEKWRQRILVGEPIIIDIYEMGLSENRDFKGIIQEYIQECESETDKSDQVQNILSEAIKNNPAISYFTCFAGPYPKYKQLIIFKKTMKDKVVYFSFWQYRNPDKFFEHIVSSLKFD